MPESSEELDDVGRMSLQARTFWPWSDEYVIKPPTRESRRYLNYQIQKPELYLFSRPQFPILRIWNIWNRGTNHSFSNSSWESRLLSILEIQKWVSSFFGMAARFLSRNHPERNVLGLFVEIFLRKKRPKRRFGPLIPSKVWLLEMTVLLAISCEI